ncbi:transporter substrate-binding domain-containing protein [Poseidonibacter lekithochrous]|uniref:transporter substrate-binding domain-containing protein n=1 Tax=Poseidonibacter TaxID=2321187 RepID=UPI001C0A26E7|nr:MULTISPECIES: transporter substrate-binding domain-containing protein [Poseidonibacter]MBU3015246.1 transporter substrate-binding domain-containing protein [Poseidonibacter lekithochrous]MDO6828544.1 transporter substrate-binding domain-containing protein [Poseidonibacter sp. 1_MG-2023]
MFKKLLLFLLLVSYIFGQEGLLNADFSQKEKNFIKNNPIITVGAEFDWAPYDFLENGKNAGLSKDYLDLIEQRSGLKFNYITDTWENLLLKAKNKEIDILPILAKTIEREKFLLFTKDYIITRDYLFAKEDNNTIKEINDIKGKRAAIIKGYVHEEILKNNYPDVKLHYSNKLLDSIDAVITNKADFFISNITLINYYLKKNGISGLNAKFQFGFNQNHLHMATTIDNPILRDILQKSLDSITIEEKNRIINKWIGTEKLNVKKSNKLDLSAEELKYIEKNKTVKIANEYDWIPYDFNENGIPKGYVVDYMKLVLGKLNIKPVFITDQWSTLYEDFKTGKIDIMPVVAYNKQRKEYMNLTQSYLSQTFSIVTKKSRTDIVNSDDLTNKKIGMIKDWTLTKKIRYAYPHANIIEFENVKDIFDAIKDNFIDVTIQNKFLANYYINKNNYGDLKIASLISLDDYDGRLHIGIQKDLKILHSLLQKAILDVSDDEIKVLEDKWVNISKKIDFTEEEKSFIKNTIIKSTSTKTWAPFNFVNNNGEMYGISIDFWNYIVEKANLKVEFIPKKTFTEAIENIKNKKSDVIIGTSQSIERDKYSIFSHTYLKSPLGIATLQDKNFIKNASELLGKKIAVGRNYTAHRLLEEKYPDMNFVFVNNPKEGLEYLSDNKVYAYIDMMPALSFNIKNFGFTNIKITGQTGIDFNLKFMIRDDYPLLKSIINKVLNQMTYKEKEDIFNVWIKTKYEEKSDYSILIKTVLVFISILLFVVYRNRQLLQYQKKLQLAKDETEKSLNNFKTLIELNIAGILIVRDKKIVYTNDEVIKILEYKSKDEIINNDVSTIFQTDNNTNLCDKLTSADSSELVAISKTNKLIPVLLKGEAVEFDNLPSHIISLIDLTDIKNKEELMLQQSKMASLGEMIGNIAHQWRQPLSSISTTSSGLKLQKEFNHLSDEVLNESLDNITKTTKFLSETIDDFQNYIKEDKLKKEFNISNSIEKVLILMKGSFTNSFIKVEHNLESITVNSYENELNQALLNILSNSKDALKNIDEKYRYMHISSYKTKTHAVIEVVDNGGGIDEKVIKKVFEPYFTTKHKSQGTGLGLYMTHKIITESMKGSIKIENCSYGDYKKCTKVTLQIPL